MSPPPPRRWQASSLHSREMEASSNKGQPEQRSKASGLYLSIRAVSCDRQGKASLPRPILHVEMMLAIVLLIILHIEAKPPTITLPKARHVFRTTSPHSLHYQGQ